MRSSIDTRDSVNIKKSTIAGSVNARDGVDVENSRIDGVCRSSMGTVNGEEASFNRIDGRDGVHLSKCDGVSAYSSMGRVRWVKTLTKGSEIDSIDGRDGVTIKSIAVTSVRSSMGTIDAESSTVGQMDGRDGVDMDDCNVRSATTSMGTASVTASTVKNNVSGRDGVTVTESTAGSAESSMGKVSARRSVVKSVEGRDGVDIEGSDVKHAISSMGKVTYLGTKSEGFEVSTLSGREGVTIEDLTSVDKVVASMGKVRAVNSTIQTMEARGKVILDGSRVKMLTLKVEEGKTGEVSLRNGAVVSAIRVEAITKSNVAYSGGNVIGSRSYSFSMSAPGMTTESFLRTFGSMVSEGQWVNLNGQEYQMKGGGLVSPASESNNSDSKSTEKKAVTLIIAGSGTVESAVEFDECEGKLDVAESVSYI